jgi:D-3-phosphoglycerate dehydrogenase
MMDKWRIAVTTSPFGQNTEEPMELLNRGMSTVVKNTAGRKFSRQEHLDFLGIHNPHIIVAGTEKYDKDALDMAPELKFISRVGIGTDGIDFDECRERGIIVCNTPYAPSNAVAELAIMQMLNMLRKVQNVSEDMLRREKWNRYIGRELKSCKVGIIGFGRCGKLVYEKLISFTPADVLINDIIEIDQTNCTKEQIYQDCDIITIHVPLKDETIDNHNFITRKELDMMKPDVRLLNLSRGGIINEKDLYEWLKDNPKACAAVDAFEKEPYHDKLATLGNAYLTPHIGSCTIQSRYDMEVGAAKTVHNYMHKNDIQNRVV